MELLFSILVCSVTKRQKYLDRLMECLKPQLTDEVEVLTEIDDGAIPIGAKRNKLLERSRGKFIAFVDDDDLVSKDYVTKILETIKANPNLDVIGMMLIMTTNGQDPQKSFHSIQYTHWWQDEDPETHRFRYYRNPNHLNPVLRGHAMRARFPDDLSFGEDRAYSARLYKYLVNEVMLKDPIYYYLFRQPKDC